MKRTLTLFTGLIALCFAMNLQAQDNMVCTINSPGGLAGEIEVGPPAADFGGNLQPGESVTGDLATVFAQNSMGNDSIAVMGCDSLLNEVDIIGNIALIQRGNCDFSNKVHYAEQAGAIAAIICNHTPGDGAITMGAGTGPFAGSITIPSGFISWEDCQVILTEIENGGTVNLTLSVPTFYDDFHAYSYHTPLAHAIPMDDIQINLVNSSGSDASNVDISVDITDPNGDVVTLTETIETFLNGADSTLSFDSYTPAMLGTYSVRFYNTLNADEILDNFVITENTFAPDRGEAYGTAGPSAAQFSTNGGYNYYYGTLSLTGSDPNTVATHCVFGLSNAAEVFTGNPTYDIINVVLYDTDVDNDGVLDWSGGTGESFDDLTPVAIGSYPITGNELPDEFISVPLTTFTGSPYQLLPDHSYTVSIQYNGSVDEAFTPPVFASTSDLNYFAYFTCLYLDNTLYNGGWAGETVVCRLIIDNMILGTDNLETLDGTAQISPNPASDFINLELNLNEAAEDVRVDIFNYTGQLLQSRDLGKVTNGVFEFDVTGMASGLYFMSIKTSVGYQSLSFTIAD
ncbi:MAG: T9SS type A sorting domain-containing protein [Saprospiraceae bacterium]|nr:T9SS type A sorting domain-containing protein [Saprospiraceae bacterium]